MIWIGPGYLSNTRRKKITKYNMQKLYLLLTLGSLIGLVAAQKELQDLFNDAAVKTRKTVDQKQLDDISGIRRELQKVADSRPDELLPKAHSFLYKTSTDKYLASRKPVVDRKTFDSSLERSCRALNEIWAKFIDFCLKKNLDLVALRDLKTRDSKGYEMFLNAGFCHDKSNARS